MGEAIVEALATLYGAIALAVVFGLVKMFDWADNNKRDDENKSE